MLRLAGTVCIVISSSLAGAALSSRLREQYLIHKLLFDMLGLICIYLENEYLTTDEILIRLSDDSISAKLVFLKNAADTSEIAEKAASCRALQGDTAVQLERYFLNFGTCDISGELAKTRLLQKNIELEKERLKERCEKYCKLYRLFGVLIGLAAAIMLI